MIATTACLCEYPSAQLFEAAAIHTQRLEIEEEDQQQQSYIPIQRWKRYPLGRRIR
jgi:hypothetical protein